MEKRPTVGNWIVGREQDRWESHRRTAGWLNVGIGLLFGVGLALVLVTGSVDRDTTVTVLVILIVPLLHGVGGVGLLRGLRWLRAALWPVSVIDLLAFPLGTVLGGYSIWVLYNTRAPAAGGANERSASAGQRRSTSPWGLSLVTLCAVVVLVGYGANRAFEQGREEFRREVDAMAGLLDSSGIPLPELNEPIPEIERARMMWAVRMSLSDLFSFYQSSAARHGFDFGAEPPGEWLQSKYLANATRYSSVRAHFASHLEWIEDVYPEALAKLKGFMWQRISQVGLNSPQLLTEMETVLEQRRAGIEMMQQVEEQYVRGALRLHDFLAKVDSRVDYDGTENVALFQLDDELSTVNRMIAEVEELSGRLDSLQGQASRQANEFIDRWGSTQTEPL